MYKYEKQGMLIRKERNKQKISKEQFAKALRCSLKEIDNIEIGQTIPSTKQIIGMCGLLGMSLALFTELYESQVTLKDILSYSDETKEQSLLGQVPLCTKKYLHNLINAGMLKNELDLRSYEKEVWAELRKDLKNILFQYKCYISVMPNDFDNIYRMYRNKSIISAFLLLMVQKMEFRLVDDVNSVRMKHFMMKEVIQETEAILKDVLGAEAALIRSIDSIAEFIYKSSQGASQPKTRRYTPLELQTLALKIKKKEKCFIFVIYETEKDRCCVEFKLSSLNSNAAPFYNMVLSKDSQKFRYVCPANWG